MEILIAVFLFLLGLVFIVKGGDYFVDAASWIAEVSGIPKFIVGATIVSIATTLPEVIVSMIAAFGGQVDMAIGNAVGSVTANTGLIMAISILFIPAALDRKKMGFKCILMIAAAAVLYIFSLKNSALSYIGSAILLVIFAVFIFENIRSAKGEADEKVEITGGKKEVTFNIIKFVVGAAGIVIGAQLLVNNATVLAKALGISETIISVTIVAIGTSLPELVTTITTIAKKQSSLSIGNIVGANIIDMAIILPICSLIAGKPLPISAQGIMYDMPVCLMIISLAMIPALLRKKFSRVQGALMILCYIAYIVLIVAIPK